jgi:hypothetical protein
MGQVSKDIILADDDFFPVMPADYGKFMVISLGCGSNRNRRYCAKAAARWGVFSWLFKDGSAPIIDMFNSASADMVDIHLCVLFRALRSSENYLRIQACIYIYICELFPSSSIIIQACMQIYDAVRSADGQRGLHRRLVQEEHG